MVYIVEMDNFHGMLRTVRQYKFLLPEYTLWAKFSHNSLIGENLSALFLRDRWSNRNILFSSLNRFSVIVALNIGLPVVGYQSASKFSLEDLLFWFIVMLTQILLLTAISVKNISGHNNLKYIEVVSSKNETIVNLKSKLEFFCKIQNFGIWRHPKFFENITNI